LFERRLIFLGGLEMPGLLPVVGWALVLLLGAVIASAIPALRAARRRDAGTANRVSFDSLAPRI